MIAKNFKLVKPFSCEFGDLPIGTELMVIRDTIFVDGNQIMPMFYRTLRNLINDEINNPDIMREIPLPNSLNYT